MNGFSNRYDVCLFSSLTLIVSMAGCSDAFAQGFWYPQASPRPVYQSPQLNPTQLRIWNHPFTTKATPVQARPLPPYLIHSHSSSPTYSVQSHPSLVAQPGSYPTQPAVIDGPSNSVTHPVSPQTDNSRSPIRQEFAPYGSLAYSSNWSLEAVPTSRTELHSVTDEALQKNGRIEQEEESEIKVVADQMQQLKSKEEAARRQLQVESDKRSQQISMLTRELERLQKDLEEATKLEIESSKIAEGTKRSLERSENLLEEAMLKLDSAVQQLDTATKRISQLEKEVENLAKENAKLKMMVKDQAEALRIAQIQRPSKTDQSIDSIQEKIRKLDENMETKLRNSEKRIRDRIANQRKRLIELGLKESDQKVKDLDKKLKVELNNNANRVRAEKASKMEILEKELQKTKSK